MSASLQEVARVDGQRRSKRKQTLPQQHDSGAFYQEDRHSIDGYISDDDDGDDDGRTGQSTQLDDSAQQQLRQQLRVVEWRLEDMCSASADWLRTDDDVRLAAWSHAATQDDDSDLARPGAARTHTDAEHRLTRVLKAQLTQVVDGLVDRLIRRFLSKQFSYRQRHQQTARTTPSPSTQHQPVLDFTQLSHVTSLPVFPPPPPLFPPLPFPVVGEEMLALRRAYVNALVQRDGSADDRDDVTVTCHGSTSGPTSCTAMTSSSTENVDQYSPVSVMTSRCLVADQRITQSHSQVSLSDSCCIEAV